MDEQSYIQGHRAAWLAMLNECLRQLGYNSPDAAHVGWVAEREDAILTLRTVCEEFGDNDWPNDLHLTDIIEKHLARYLEG